LARLLQETGETDKNKSIIASLNLSLEQLEPEVRQWLPPLGVFEGGAMEPMVLEVTGCSDEAWRDTRSALEAVGLLVPKSLPGVTVPYLKFHPTLMPVLWSQLPEEVRAKLAARHRQEYYELSGTLYQRDQQLPHQARAIVMRELPNLLVAARGALAAEEAWAVEFIDTVNRFLYLFALGKEREALERSVARLAGEVGSDNWFLARSNFGQRLLDAGRAGEAMAVFEKVLARLEEQPSYYRCFTLTHLGRCSRVLGQSSRAVECSRQALAELERLEPSDLVKQHMATTRYPAQNYQASTSKACDLVKQHMAATQSDLGDALRDCGNYAEAREAYEASLAIARKLGDARVAAVADLQLGTLALFQNDLAEAERRYREALTAFQQLSEPATKAKTWHQLGIVYQQAKRWEAAESAYREAARLKEFFGDRADAATTWNQLAILYQLIGKLEAAEALCWKAISGFKAAGDSFLVSKVLGNLANILRLLPGRLDEARRLAEQALANLQLLDPAAAEIWNIYYILVEITNQQGDSARARDYRHKMIQAMEAFEGTRHLLRQDRQFITGVVTAMEDANARRQLEAGMEQVPKHQANLVAAIRRLLAGERDEDTLCKGLELWESVIVVHILRGLENPETLNDLLSDE
jgi:tetratricopeptide (TPR) repeat protein